MANGTQTEDKVEKLSDDATAVLSHMGTLGAARTIEEIQNSYDLNRDREDNPQVSKSGIESAVKSLVKAKLVHKVGNAGVDGDGDPAYALVGINE
jgi:hypothetical protein